MLGPTVTVTPATCDRGIAGDFCALPAGHDGACNPTIRLVPNAPAGEDIYRQCAAPYVGAGTIAPGPGLDYLRDHLASDERFRQLIDTAVRLTEQRVRAECEADLKLTEGAATVIIDGLSAERDAAVARAQAAETARDHAEMDVATLADRLARAEAPLSAADLTPLTDLRAGDRVTVADVRRLARELTEARAERDALAQRARVVDVTQLNEAGTRSLCNTCGHEQFTPARPLYATESAEQASVVPPDPNGPEGGSGGAA
jgi:hypothetical protein